MEILYQDSQILVCIKPPRVLSTDEPGGLPELIRDALGDPSADIRTVHRLDRVVSGLMVLARNASAASELSRQIREGDFQKEYLAVLHGCPETSQGTLRDLLLHCKQERKTYVGDHMEKGVQEAVLNYHVLNQANGLSRVAVHLVTGRTHQIRAQFSARQLPLLGDVRYGSKDSRCQTALWSCRLALRHPATGLPLDIFCPPPRVFPWNCFDSSLYAPSLAVSP